MAEAPAGKKANPLLLSGPSEYKIRTEGWFNFPLHPERDLLRLDNILTWVHQLPRPTPEERQSLREKTRGYYRDTPWGPRREQPTPEDQHLGDLYYAEFLRDNLQEILSLAIRCLNYTPLIPESIPIPKGQPSWKAAAEIHEALGGPNSRDEKVRVVVRHAIEAGRLEAVDAVLALLTSWCGRSFDELQQQYTKKTSLGGVYDSEPLSAIEQEMMSKFGYSYKAIFKSRKIADEWQGILRDKMERIKRLRRGIRRFYPPSEQFLIESKDHSGMEEYPWEKLADRMKGENPGIRQAFITLGIKPTDNPRAIKDAYRRAIKASHPDHGGSPQQFQAVQNAYNESLAFANAGLLDGNFFRTQEEPEEEKRERDHRPRVYRFN